MSASLNQDFAASEERLSSISIVPAIEMPTAPKKGWFRALPTLSIAGVLAVAFLAAGATMMYENMQRAETDRGWVDHTQTVLTNLQLQTQWLDRVDSNMQLFVATSDATRLRATQRPLSELAADQQQLRELVQDNPDQLARAKEAEKSLATVTASVESLATTKTIPQKELLAVRSQLAVMTAEERTLLQSRTVTSQRTAYRGFALGGVYLGISFLIIVTLFVILLRQSRESDANEERLNFAREQLESTVKRLVDRAHESNLLVSARDEFQLCTTTEEAHDCFVRHMSLLLPGTSGATLSINNSRSMVEICSTWGGATPLLDGFNPDACCGLRAGKARWRRRGKSELHCMHFAGKAPENYLCVPMVAHGETHGFVCIGCDTEKSLHTAEERNPLIQEMVELASLSIASLQLRAKLEGQSIRDGLTGLFNRHFMEIALERELHRAERQNNSLAVLMLDVDHFKKLNDTFGHEAGDMVLREVAQCFRDSLREEDIICRYGGEEFLVIMPDTIEEAALHRAETIRTTMAERRIRFRGEMVPMVTVSIGVAMYPRSSRQGLNLIQLADGALYRAKHGGRNQVMLDAPALA